MIYLGSFQKYILMLLEMVGEIGNITLCRIMGTWTTETIMMRTKQIADHLSNITSKASILAMSRDTFVAFQLNAIKNIVYQEFSI